MPAAGPLSPLLSVPRSTTDNKTYAVHWTAFYVRADKGWQLAASHATRGKEIIP